jgi:hypothetical protein
MTRFLLIDALDNPLAGDPSLTSDVALDISLVETAILTGMREKRAYIRGAVRRMSKAVFGLRLKNLKSPRVAHPLNR